MSTDHTEQGAADAPAMDGMTYEAIKSRLEQLQRDYAKATTLLREMERTAEERIGGLEGRLRLELEDRKLIEVERDGAWAHAHRIDAELATQTARAEQAERDGDVLRELVISYRCDHDTRHGMIDMRMGECDCCLCEEARLALAAATPAESSTPGDAGDGGGDAAV
jgi:hypothetical protein